MAMNSTNGVSVIICTWNRADTLRTTLDSLSAQQGCDALNLEVIVVDNNSTDHTRTIVEQAAQGWKLGSLRYLFEARQGKQFALNAGIAAARESILAFSDDDILLDVGWIAGLAAAFADPSVEMAGGRTLISWPPSGRPRWFHDGMMAVLGGVDLGDRVLRPAPAAYVPAGANLVARRALFDRVGGFSEAHFRHMDHEFGVRCQRAGVGIAYFPSLEVHAPVDPACLNKRYFRRWAFKAGIALDDSEKSQSVGPQPPAAWLYKQLVLDVCMTLLSLLARNTAEVFLRELRGWRAFGAIASYWRFRFRPASHAQWVEKYSQKRGGLY